MHRKYWYWINNIEGIGNAKIRHLISRFGDPETVFNSEQRELEELPNLNVRDVENIFSKENKKKILEEFERDTEKGKNFVFPDESEYPEGLREIYDKPYVLYYRGGLPGKKDRNIGIVGSRNCSFYGKRMAEELGRILGSRGFNVVSGLALGIDVEAHRGTIMAGGRTYAVLAGGTDLCYPRQNYNTYVDILKSGGIISEYRDGTRTTPGMFPLRNRIISGLCEAVIVVEAGVNSGSLITANYALEQNKRVFAIPGRVGDACSLGTNNLIWQGAEIITSFDSFLTSLEGNNEQCPGIGDEDRTNIALATNEKMLYNLLLDFSPKSLDTIFSESGMLMKDVFTGLMSLELRGLIREVSKNFYVRIG